MLHKAIDQALLVKPQRDGHHDVNATKSSSRAEPQTVTAGPVEAQELGFDMRPVPLEANLVLVHGNM